MPTSRPVPVANWSPIPEPEPEDSPVGQIPSTGAFRANRTSGRTSRPVDSVEEVGGRRRRSRPHNIPTPKVSTWSACLGQVGTEISKKLKEMSILKSDLAYLYRRRDELGRIMKKRGKS